MNHSTILILDLDDTIFETKTISMDQVALIFEHFREATKSDYSPGELDNIILDLWRVPFDVVAKKYGFSSEVQAKFSEAVELQEYNFNIQPFPDFDMLTGISASKVLVTTGFKKLQLAKIGALEIESVFEEIHIDEVDSQNRIHKKGIFESILNQASNLINGFVIGDNPESELKAGRQLGLKTIQVARYGQKKSHYSDHVITNFSELKKLIK